MVRVLRLVRILRLLRFAKESSELQARDPPRSGPRSAEIRPDPPRSGQIRTDQARSGERLARPPLLPGCIAATSRLPLARLPASSRQALAACVRRCLPALRLLLFFLMLQNLILGGFVFHAEARVRSRRISARLFSSPLGYALRFPRRFRDASETFSETFPRRFRDYRKG